MAERNNNQKGTQDVGFDDVYTVILALACLALVGTTTVVCVYGHQLFGSIFALAGP